MLPIRTRATCPQCERVFDLLDEDDAGEWYYGHDCEPVLAYSMPPTFDSIDVYGNDPYEMEG